MTLSQSRTIDKSALTFVNSRVAHTSKSARLLSDKSRFANNLRVSREAAGLTQAELAGRIGKSRATVINWEDPEKTTMPAEADVDALAKELKIEKAELRYGDAVRAPRRVSESAPVSYANLPVHLMKMASSFELEALEMGADEPMMRWVAQALRSPESVTMFRMGYDGKEASPNDQLKFMESHIAKLRALVKERVKRNRLK